MTPVLSDAQIERYSRQILLPEVGGRGQARLLASRLLIAGGGDAARVAARFAARAGIGRIALLGAAGWRPDPGPDCHVSEVALDDTTPADVVVDLAGDTAVSAVLGARALAAGHPLVLGTIGSSGAALATLVGRPCVRCVAETAFSGDHADDGNPLAAPLALALGALAADEAVLALLAPPTRGRLHVLGLDDGTLAAHPLESARGCTACGGNA